MNNLQQRLEDQDYGNWVKAGLCLALLKEGLEDFADLQSKDFHQNVLAQVVNIQPAQGWVCANETISFGKNNQGSISCNHPYCQGFLDAVVQVGIDPYQRFTIRRQNIDNCNVKLWHNDPWELSKLFMNPGQLPTQTSPSQTDLSGIVNFLSHCRIPRDNITNNTSIDMVRQARNSIMHSVDMRLPPADFMALTQSMMALLQDPKAIVTQPSAQKALSEIEKVRRSDFTISMENERKVIKDLIAELHKVTEESRTEMKELRAAFQDRKKVTDAEKEAMQEQIRQTESETNKVGQSFAVLKRRLTENVTIQESTALELTELHRSLEQAKEETRMSHNDLIHRLVGLENKVADAERERTILYKRQSDIENQVKAIETQKVGEEACLCLRKALIAEYTRVYKEMSLSPIYEGLTDVALRVPLDKTYCRLMILKHEGEKTTLLESYEKMFADSNIKNIVIKGEGGTGKSTWCKRLLHAWCQAQRNKLGMQGTSSIDEANIDMERALKRFDYLFFVPLRYVKCQTAIKDMLFSAGLERLSEYQDVCKYVFAQFSDKVLVLVDGFDEYPFTLDCYGLLQSTFILTTRPWKYDFLCSEVETFKVDAVMTIHGLSDIGVEKLANNVIVAYKNWQSSAVLENLSNEELTQICLNDIESADLSKSVKIPLILIITVLSWLLNNKSLSSSLPCIILDLLNIVFLRGEGRLSEDEKSYLHQTEADMYKKVTFRSYYLAKYKYLSTYQTLLLKLGRLAFSGLISENKIRALVFTDRQYHNFLKPEELNICYKLGLLTTSVVCISPLESKRISVSFYHKMIQELFAALWVVSGDDALNNFKSSIKTYEDTFELENVMLYVCGLKALTGSAITKYLVDLFNTDNSICEYRKRISRMNDDEGRPLERFTMILLKCMMEMSKTDQIEPLYITDIHASEIGLRRLLQLIDYGRGCLKSVVLSEGIQNEPCEHLLKVAHSVCQAQSLQKLELQFEANICNNTDKTCSIHFDFSNNSNLEVLMLLSRPETLVQCSVNLQLRHVSLESVELLKVKGARGTKLETVNFKSVTMSQPMWAYFCLCLRSADLSRLHLENINTNLENSSRLDRLVLIDIKINDIKLVEPTELKFVKLKSVIMQESSWSRFWQALQPPHLNKLKLENLGINEMIINIKNSVKFQSLVVENVQASGIEIPSTKELEYVILTSVSMQQPSLNRFFQALQSANLAILDIRHLNASEIDINLENSCRLRNFCIKNASVSEIKLPKKLEVVYLHSVSMSQSSWSRFFQTLASLEIDKLILINLCTQKLVINLGNMLNLKYLELRNVQVNDIKIATFKMLSLMKLESVTMPLASWASLFQSLQLVDMSWFNLQNLNYDDAVLNLENIPDMYCLDLENVTLSEIKLPINTKRLSRVCLKSVIMSHSSWNSFFDFLQSVDVHTLILDNLNIDDISVIVMTNCLEISNMTISQIKVSNQARLKTVNVDTVVLQTSQDTYSPVQTLLYANLTELVFKNFNTGSGALCFDNCSKLELIDIEDVIMSQESYCSLSALLAKLPAGDKQKKIQSTDTTLLNVQVTYKKYKYKEPRSHSRMEFFLID